MLRTVDRPSHVRSSPECQLARRTAKFQRSNSTRVRVSSVVYADLSVTLCTDKTAVVAKSVGRWPGYNLSPIEANFAWHARARARMRSMTRLSRPPSFPSFLPCMSFTLFRARSHLAGLSSRREQARRIFVSPARPRDLGGEICKKNPCFANQPADKVSRYPV